MLGKTNACVGGSGGGGGKTIEVLNKTGAVINQGDKVWLSENTQSADTSYILDSGSANFGSYGFINSSGLVAYGSKGKYSLDATSGTLIDSSFTIFPYLLYYTSAGCMYYRQRSGGASGLGVYFITPTGEVSWSMPTLINSNGYSVSTSSSVSTIKKYNTLTQELEQTWETTLPSSSYSVYFIVKNKVYVGYSNAFKYKTLYDDGTVSESWIDTKKPSSLPSANCIIGNTLDEKYIVSIGNNYNYGFQSGGAKLQMWETLDSGDIVYLTQSEMPADLQKYVDGNNLITFNPKNGVLAVCKYQEQTYDIVKYENETWTKLPVELNLEEGEIFMSAITLSEDLTRACVRTTNGAKIFNLTDLKGYTAISYNPSVVNENTITATALAESQPNEFTQVQIGSVTNENLTVTENGTYTPSATYTGFGSVNVNVKGAEKIEAVNKTGSSIAKGDKVWVNENYQGDVSRYVWLEQASSFGGCIDRTGTFGVTNGKGYNIGDTEATYAYNVTGGNPQTLVYGDDNSILTGVTNFLYRIDGKSQFSINVPAVNSFCSKYVLYNNIYLLELNMTTGESSKYWQLSASVSSVVVIDNTAYTFSPNASNTPIYYSDLPEKGGGTITLSTKTSIANYTRSYYIPLGITSDNKYIVMAKGSSIKSSPFSGVTFFEVLGKGQLKELSSGELPTDLQPYYSANCYITFNPYTGILTACVNGGTDYVIMKYENGEWTKVAVDLTLFSGCTFLGPITLSDDLTRACLMQNYSPYSTYYASVYNLPTTEGYGAIAYNTRNITENTITGYAMTDAEPNETVTVSVPAEV